MGVARFWREQDNRYNLIGVKCGNCSKIFFPPLKMCSDCHRLSIGKMEKQQMAGKGKVVSYSIVHEGPDAFKMQVPYIMAIIELEEGPRIISQVVGCNHEDVAIGAPVKMVFRKIREESKQGIVHYWYKFTLAEPPDKSCSEEK